MSLSSVALLLTIFINAILAVTVYFKSKKNLSTLFFFFIILGIFFWSGALSFYNFLENQRIALIFSKIAYFASAFSMLSVFNFVIFFNSKIKNLREKYFLIIFNFFGILFLSLAMIDSMLLKGFSVFNSKKHIIIFGPLYPIYTFFISFLFIASFFILYKKYQRETNRLKKIQLKYIFIGLLTAITGIIITNLVLPSFSIFSFYWLGPIFTLEMVAFITLAITRHRLFDMKIMVTQLLVFVLWIVLFGRLLLATTWQRAAVDGFLLFLVIVFGILLIRSVLKEVRTREQLQTLTARLKSANLRLKKLDEAKSEFISIASHQLRAPLTSIKGYSSMLLEGSFGKLPKETQVPLKRIFDSSLRLVALVGDFLNLSRIERGKMEYNFKKTNLRKLVSDTVEEFKAMNSKNLEIKFEADGKEELDVAVDENKIRQVFTNIIDNAVKYTPKGFVHIFLYKNPEKKTVIFKVKDSGMGMNSETRSRIFQKFSRAREGISKIDTEGLGMGLYIAKRIVNDHGGRVWAESSGEEKGSSFYVELPVNSSRAKHQPAS